MFLDAQDLREFDSGSGSELPDGDSGRARSNEMCTHLQCNFATRQAFQHRDAYHLPIPVG